MRIFFSHINLKDIFNKIYIFKKKGFFVFTLNLDSTECVELWHINYTVIGLLAYGTGVPSNNMINVTISN